MQQKSIFIRFSLLVIIAGLALSVQAQSTGDYRTTGSGNWSTLSTWERYNGSAWVTATSKPASTNNVYIEDNHTVTLTGNESCLNLCLYNNSGTKIITGTHTLDISGLIKSYFFAAPGFFTTPPNVANYINTQGGGKIRFVGNGRVISYFWEWNANPYGWNVEFALNAGQIAYIFSHFKAGTINITSGDVYVLGSLYFLAGNGSAGTGSITVGANSTLTIGNGRIQRDLSTGNSSSSHMGTFTLNGTLAFVGSNCILGASTLNLNGTINYSGNTQNMISRGGSTSGAQPSTVNNVNISGAGTKTLSVNTTVNGTFSILSSTVFSDGSSSLSYGSQGTLAYTNAGTRNTGDEFPSSNGPQNLTVDNSGSVLTLNAARTINGTLNLTDGKVVTTSSNRLTLGVGSTVSGSNSSSYVDGPLDIALASTSNNITLPIGKNDTYRPITLLLNHSSAALTTYTAELMEGAPTSRTLPIGLNNVSNTNYYTLSKTSGANILNGSTIKINYESGDGVDDHTQLRIAKDDGAGNWVNLGGVGTAAQSGTITSTVAFSTLGDFVLANVTNLLSAGDYRSTQSGNWTRTNRWEVYNGSSWVSATDYPRADDNVFIQANHTIRLNANLSCNDLHIEGSSSGTRLNTRGYILSINGKLRSFTGTAPGTSAIPTTNAAQIRTPISGGRLRFVGTSRNITLPGEWDARASGFDVEFALNFGQVATLNTHFRAGNVTITTGTLRVPNFYAVRVDEGTPGTGDITVGVSGKLSTHSTTISQNGSKRDNTHIGNFIVDGLWEITGPNTRVGAANIEFNGTVRYINSTGNTNLANKGNFVTGADDPFTYNHLEIQGNYRRIIMADTRVNGNLQLSQAGQGNVLDLGDYNLTMGPDAQFLGSFNKFNMVLTEGTGEVRKIFDAPGTFTFPLGDYNGFADYSPVTVKINSASNYGGYVGVKVTPQKDPDNNDPTNYIKRHWTTSTTITNYSADVDYTYAQSDVVGNEQQVRSSRFTTGWNVHGVANQAANKLSIGGINNMGRLTGKGQNNLLERNTNEQIEETDKEREVISADAKVEVKPEQDKQPTTKAPVKQSLTEQLAANIYPNPFRDALNINIEGGIEEGTIAIYSLNGQMVNSTEVNTALGNVYTINTSSLPSGAYIVRITGADQMITKKIIKAN